MQKILVFLSLLISVKAFSQGKAVISGSTDNGTTQVIVSNDKYYLGKKQEIITVPVKDNKFTTNVDLDHSRIVNVKIGAQTFDVFVEAGDSIVVDSKTGVLGFSGKGSVNNTFLKKFNETFSSVLSRAAVEEKIKATQVDAFEMTLFSNKKKQNEFYNGYADKSQLSPSFKTYIENTIKYNYWGGLLSFPIVTANSNKGMTVTPLPAPMLEGFDKTKVSDDVALTSDQYRNFLIYFVTYFTSELNGFNKFSDPALSLQKKYFLANQYLKDESFRFYLAKFLSDDCDKIPSEAVKKVFNVLAWSDNNGMYSKIVKEKCGAHMEAKEVQEGGEVPDLKLKGLDGKMHSLTDFKGKVVYIDFWASWCGPCRQQFPFAKELKSKLNDKQKKQIEFLYISIDNTEDIWKNAITANGLEGYHLFSPGGWSSEVVKFFKINGIPRYMILDKKGNIVSGNASRPSQPETLEELLKLL